MIKKTRNLIATLLIRLAWKFSDELYWDVKLNLSDFLYYGYDWSHDKELDHRTREYKMADRFIRTHRIKAHRAQQAIDKIKNTKWAIDDDIFIYNEKLELEAIERDCKFGINPTPKN